MLLLNIYALNFLTLGLFSALLGILLLRSRGRSAATLWLGLLFLTLAGFSASYVVAHAVMHPMAAYHRFGSVLGVGVALIFATGFALQYPDNANGPLARRSLLILFVVWLAVAVAFGLLAPPSGILFRVSGEYFDFRSSVPSIFVGVFINIYLLIFVAAGLWRRAQLKSDPNRRRGLSAFMAAMLGGTFFPATLNLAARIGWIEYGLWSWIFALNVIGFCWAVMVIYLSTSSDRTTIMTKILGLSVTTLAIVLHVAVALGLDFRIQSYDEMRIREMELNLRAPATPNPALVSGEARSALNGFQITDRSGAGDAGLFVTRHSYVAPDSGQIWMADFPYLEYRRYLHRPALAFALLILLALIVVPLLLPLLFRGSLLEPLQRLINGVRAVNDGQLSVQIPVKGEDEVGFLSASFNTMVHSIRESHANLDQKVADRTEELHAALKKLTELDRVKTDFFANVSHELRTPLTLLLGPMESLLQGEAGELTAGQRSLLESMQRNGERLLRLINGLLDFSRLEAGKMTVVARELDLAETVRELSAAFASAAAARSLEFHVQTPPRLPALVDLEKFEKILLNLIGNAVKFTESGGIAITLREEKQSAHVSVRDTGPGIPLEQQEVIFERFGQARGSQQGTGIGLALARELVELMGGRLTVTSAPGEGATFEFTLPLRLEARADPASSDGTSSPAAGGLRSGLGTALARLAAAELRFTDGRGDESILDGGMPGPQRSTESILIVEDTHDLRKYLYFLVAPYYRVITARNGKEGLDRARLHRPDLILSDVMMPEMNGYELLQAVREDADLRDTPVILLSARAELSTRVQGLDMGADDYLVKPFNSRELIARLNSQIRIVRMQKDLRAMRDRLAAFNQELAERIASQSGKLMRSQRFQNYLPPQLVEALLAQEVSDGVRHERKELTIFFSDLVDFTRITEDLDPEKLAALLNEYLSEMTAIALKHGGAIDKFVGDAILIHFGHYRSMGVAEDACAAVAMAIEMQLRMRELSAIWIERGYSEPFQMRCGINTGFVAVGNFGSEARLEYTVIGSNANLASRIQAQASPGGILVGHATWALVRTRFRLSPAGDLSAKGFYKKTPVYSVEF